MPTFTRPNGETPPTKRTKPARWRVWGLREVVDSRGNYHASAGSAIGGQFIPKPGSSALGGDEPSSGAQALAKVLTPEAPDYETLQIGSVEHVVPLGGGVNTTLLVTLENGTKAVYKPEVGEAWQLQFSNSDIGRTSPTGSSRWPSARPPHMRWTPRWVSGSCRRRSITPSWRA